MMAVPVIVVGVIVPVAVIVIVDDCAHSGFLYFLRALTSAGCTTPDLLPNELRS